MSLELAIVFRMLRCVIWNIFTFSECLYPVLDQLVSHVNRAWVILPLCCSHVNYLKLTAFISQMVCLFVCLQVAPLCLGRAGACVVTVKLWIIFSGKMTFSCIDSEDYFFLKQTTSAPINTRHRISTTAKCSVWSWHERVVLMDQYEALFKNFSWLGIC